MSIDVKMAAKTDTVTNRFKKVAKQGNSLSAAMNVCGEIIISSIESNFEAEGRFSSVGSWRGGSSRWADLSDRTKEARARAGKWPGKMLQMSQGGLAASISKNVQGNTLTVGTNKAYAAIHQFGGQAGRGRKVTIPARPFLVVQDEDIEDMMDVLSKHMEKS